MRALFTKMIKDKKNMLLAFTLSVIVFIEVYIILFPVIQDQAEELNALISAYPDSFLKAFGIESTETLFTHVESYLASEMFGLFWPILAVIFSISLANYAVSAERERGTIELLLSFPASRFKILLSRYLSGAFLLGVFSAATIFVPTLFLLAHGIEFDINKFWVIFIGAMLFNLTIFSVSLFFSTLFSEKGKVSMITGGIVATMYVINIVSGLKENLSDLKYFSFFNYYRADALLGRGEFVDGSIMVFLVFIVIFSSLSFYSFSKRDLY